MSNFPNAVRLANFIQADNPKGIKHAWMSGTSKEKEIMSAVLVTAQANISMSPEMLECVESILNGD